jgi:O-acetyl-ADP-ribose deacetylase (regulator of RNase III)
MGAGLALQLKQRRPELYRTYQRICSSSYLRPGDVRSFINENDSGIVLMATKDHWKDPSRIEWIKLGMSNLFRDSQELGFTKVAIPKIGCGLGMLDWHEVKPIIEAYNSPLMQITIV